MWTMPFGIVQRLAVDGQARMAGGAEQVEQVASVVSAATATMSARGTMTSSTRMRWKPSTFLSIARSWGEKSASSTRFGEGVLEIVADRIAGFQTEAGQDPVVPVVAQAFRLREGPERAVVATSIFIHSC